MSLFPNEWDEVFVCDCCLERLREVERSRLQPTSPQPRGISRRVYFIGADEGPIKIGMSANPEARRIELQTGHPVRLRVLAETSGERALEASYHARFADRRLAGEWFQRCPEILAEIERLSIRCDRPAISEKLPGSSHQPLTPKDQKQ